MSFKRVDVLNPGAGSARGAAVVELAHRDVAGVVADEDVAGAGVVVEAGAPGGAEVAAEAAPARGTVKLKIPAERKGRVSTGFQQVPMSAWAYGNSAETAGQDGGARNPDPRADGTSCIQLD